MRDYPAAEPLLEGLIASSSNEMQTKARLRRAQLHADLGAFEIATREARLASELSGWELNVMTEADAEENES